MAQVQWGMVFESGTLHGPGPVGNGVRVKDSPGNGLPQGLGSSLGNAVRVIPQGLGLGPGLGEWCLGHPR